MRQAMLLSLQGSTHSGGVLRQGKSLYFNSSSHVAFVDDVKRREACRMKEDGKTAYAPHAWGACRETEGSSEGGAARGVLQSRGYLPPSHP